MARTADARDARAQSTTATHPGRLSPAAAGNPLPRTDGKEAREAREAQVGLKADKADDASPDADPAMTLTQTDLNRLSSLTGKNILTRDDLISQIVFLSCVSVDGTQVPLEPGLLSRLKSRCYKQSFPEFLRETITRQLHSFCGW